MLISQPDAVWSRAGYARTEHAAVRVCDDGPQICVGTLAGRRMPCGPAWRGVTMSSSTSLFCLAVALAVDAYSILGVRLVLMFVLMLASAICEGLVLANAVAIVRDNGTNRDGRKCHHDHIGRGTRFCRARYSVEHGRGRRFGVDPASCCRHDISCASLSSDATGSPLRGALATARVRCRHRSRLAVFAAGTIGADVLGALTTDCLARLSFLSARVPARQLLATFCCDADCDCGVDRSRGHGSHVVACRRSLLQSPEMVSRSLDLEASLLSPMPISVATGGEMMGAMKLIKATAREAAGKPTALLPR